MVTVRVVSRAHSRRLASVTEFGYFRAVDGNPSERRRLMSISTIIDTPAVGFAIGRFR
jgi:hypothetical protein